MEDIKEINPNKLKELTSISIILPIDDQKLKYLKTVKEDTIINITNSYKNKIDESLYYKEISHIISLLNTHHRQYNLKFEVNNRLLFEKSNLLTKSNNNVNLIIVNEGGTYTPNEFKEEENYLNTLISPIKNSQLTTFEKFIAAYNLVKNFKTYKDNPKDSTDARVLKKILKNNYIVCSGYTSLLKVILDKLSIPNMKVSPEIDYFNHPQKYYLFEEHERLVVHLEDKKYNLYGLYLADPTWDSNPSEDLYQYCAITFQKEEEAYYMEKLSNFDLLTNCTCFCDIVPRIDYFIKLNMHKHNYSNDHLKFIEAIKDLYYEVSQILANLDYPEYCKLYNEYHEIFNIKTEELDYKKYEEKIGYFIVDYISYITCKSNHEISEEKLYQAIKKVKTTINGFNEKELNEWEKITKISNFDEEYLNFPYKFYPYKYPNPYNGYVDKLLFGGNKHGNF